MRSAMYYFFLLVVFFSCTVVCEDCITFNFENGLEDFNNEGICEGLDMWKLGNYSRLPMDGFHPESSVFATTLMSGSCMSSPMFQMQTGGTLQVNLYLQPNTQTFQNMVLISQFVEGSNHISVGTGSPFAREGWQIMNISVIGSRSFLGYVTIVGIPSGPSSAVFLDSFRYIPPSKKEEECPIYKEVDVIDPEEDSEEDPEEDKKPRYSMFFMIKMGILKIFN